MLKRFWVFVVCILMLGSLAGCFNTYTPSVTEKYFVMGDDFRVFTLQSEEGRKVKAYPLHSSMMPSVGLDELSITVTEVFTKNTMFFEGADFVNKAGVIAIYDAIKIKPNELQDTASWCSSVFLTYYNKKYVLPTPTTSLVSLKDKPDFTVYGDVADVTIYTINFEDRSAKSGKFGKTGSFKAIVCDTPYFSDFVVRKS